MLLLIANKTSRYLIKTVYPALKTVNSRILTHTLKFNTNRCLCSKPLNNPEFQDTVKSSKNLAWKQIYNFPMIRFGRFLNRLKLYQTIFTVTTLPIFVGLYCYDMSNLTNVMTVTAISTCTLATLYVTTSFFKRLIGIIYIDENVKNVKICHLTFWGNRNDIIVPLDEIIPLTDGKCNGSDAFVKLYRINSDEFFYLTLRFGRILDKDIFQNIFGSFDLLGIKK